MPVRATTNSNYARVLAGLRFNLANLVLQQERVATGRRILRPSDDPAGAVRVLSLNRQIASSGRFVDAIGLGRAAVDSAAVALETGSGLLAEARETLIQGMNGTLSQDDREALAVKIELVRDALLEASNTRYGDRALFGGTSSGVLAFEEVLVGGHPRAVYVGNGDEQKIRIGNGVEIPINSAGSSIFALEQASGTAYAGLTGAAAGLTADEGSGYEYLTLRHDATNSGTIGTVGLALANGGADDTFLGTATLVVDAVAGTVQFGGGPVRSLPQPGDPDIADFTVANASGGELHLDFGAFGGTSFTGTLSASGSIAIDGANFVAIDFAEQDLELVHPDSSNILHVDLTGVTRSGVELVSYTGKVNAFDALQGIADDLRNGDGLSQTEMLARLDTWLSELDRNHENLVVSLGSFGARSERLTNTEDRLQGVLVQLSGLRSDELDADLAEAALEMARAQQSLELAQASGVRLLQTNLFDFLS